MSPKYVFDASSIIASIIRRRADLVMENYTIELAGYEIGNYLWKETYLTKSISDDELSVLEGIFLKVLERMNVVKGWPPHAETVRLAGELDLSYYDAAYIRRAKELGLALVTEDKRLREGARKVVKAISIEDVI